MQKRKQKITSTSKKHKKQKNLTKKSIKSSQIKINQSKQYSQLNSISNLLSFNSDNKIFSNNHKKLFKEESQIEKISNLKNKILKKSVSENNLKKNKKKKKHKHKKQKTLTKTFNKKNLLDQFSDYSTETQKISQNSFIFLKPQIIKEKPREKQDQLNQQNDDLRLKYLLDKCRQFKLLDEEIQRKKNIVREQSKTINIICQKKQKIEYDNEQIFEENLDNFVNKISQDQFTQSLKTFEFNKYYFNSTIFQDEEFLLGFLEQIFQFIIKDQELKKHLKINIFTEFTIQEYDFQPILPLNLFWQVIQEFDKEYAEQKFFQYYCKMIFDSLNQELDIKRFQYFYHCQIYYQTQNILKPYFTFGNVYQDIINKMIFFDKNKIKYESTDLEQLQEQILHEISEEKDIFQLQIYEENETKEQLSQFVFDYLIQDIVLDYFLQLNQLQINDKIFLFFS